MEFPPINSRVKLLEIRREMELRKARIAKLERENKDCTVDKRRLEIMQAICVDYTAEVHRAEMSSFLDLEKP